MGKRITRYWGQQLPEKLPALVGQPMDLVTKSGKTIHVTLKQFDGAVLIVRNFRGKKEGIPLAQVDEIILTHESSY